jgi:hypothetical protein
MLLSTTSNYYNPVENDDDMDSTSTSDILKISSNEEFHEGAMVPRTKSPSLQIHHQLLLSTPTPTK